MFFSLFAFHGKMGGFKQNAVLFVPSLLIKNRACDTLSSIKMGFKKAQRVWTTCLRHVGRLLKLVKLVTDEGHVGGVLLVLLLHELGQPLELGPHVVEAILCQTHNVGPIGF